MPDHPSWVRISELTLRLIEAERKPVPGPFASRHIRRIGGAVYIHLEGDVLTELLRRKRKSETIDDVILRVFEV